MTTTDHRTVAEDMLTAAAGEEIGSIREHYYMTAAQVHATLALGEQQRLVAQIEYVKLLESQYRESTTHPDEFDQATKTASLERHAEVLRQIREGLGLS
ncbi:MAG: hypothetical protein ABWY57_15855 [Mycetocola sp.]